MNKRFTPNVYDQDGNLLLGEMRQQTASVFVLKSEYDALETKYYALLDESEKPCKACGA